MKIFDIDGPFQHYGSMLYDLLIANLAWLFVTVFSFGLLSGPATMALYQSVYQGVILKEAYPFKTFFVSLKKRFFFQLGFSLFFFTLLFLSVFNLFLTYTGRFGSIWLLPVYFFIFIELALTATVALPLLSQNRSLSFMNLIKISFIVANKHLPWVFLATIPNAFVVFISLLSFFYVPASVLLFFVPVLAALGISQLILKKILAPYDYFENFVIGNQ